MLFQSESFQVAFVKDNIAEFKFCVPGSVNKLSQQTLSDCGAALKELAANKDIKGIVIEGEEYKLSQYADDTSIISDGTHCCH